MISWQQRAFRIPATSLRLNKTRAIVHAPRKKLNTGFGFDASGKNATKKEVDQDPPDSAGSFVEKLTAKYRSLVSPLPEESLGTRAQVDVPDVQVNIRSNEEPEKLKPDTGSEVNVRNKTKENANRDPPKPTIDVIQKLRPPPEQFLGILRATKLQELQADVYDTQFSATSASNLQTITPGVPKAPTVDFLALAISTASTVEAFFQVVEQHGSVMSKNHLLFCLRNFTKLLEIGYSPEALKATPAFRHLTEIILKREKLFDAQDCIEIFKSICKLKLGADSSLGREILAVLGRNAKDLTLHELMQFAPLIRNVEGKGPHLKLMKLVIRDSFRTRFRDEIDLNSIDQCHSSLIFILTSEVDSETSEAIVDAALKVAPRFTTRQAVTVLHHAGDRASLARNSESLRQIISQCMQIVSTALPEMDEQTIEQIILSCRQYRTATKSFLDALWELAPSWSLSQVGNLLRLCFKQDCGYMTPEVAEAVTQMLIEKRAQLSNKLSARSVTLFAETIALCSRNHQPGSDGMARCVQAANNLIEAATCIKGLTYKKRPLELLIFLQALSYLGVYPDSLLQEAFAVGNKGDGYLKKVSASLLLQLELQVTIHYCGNPPYQIDSETRKSLPVPSEPETRNDPLMQALVAVLGDEGFVHTGVETALGSRADYVVALKGKNQPILIHNTRLFFQALPFGTKVVAFLIGRCGRDQFNLTGMEKLHISIWERQLRAQTLCPVIVNENTLSCLDPAEAALRVATALDRAYDNGCEYRHNFLSKEVHSVVRM